MLKKRRWIGLSVFFLLLAGAGILVVSKKHSVAEQDPSREMISEKYLEARIVMVIRDVSLVRKGERKKIQTGDLVFEEDLIETQKSSAVELLLEGRFRILIRESSRFSIKTLKDLASQKGDKQTKYGFLLDRGRVMVQIQPLNSEESFNIYTPALAVGVRGTGFSVAAEDWDAVLKVRQGRVMVSRNIQVPNAYEDQIRVLAEEGEQVQIRLEENREVLKSVGSGKAELPRITKEKVAQNDEELLYYDRYFSLLSDPAGGTLEVSRTDGAAVFINGIYLGNGDLIRYLASGTYVLKVESASRIFESEIQIVSGEVLRLTPVMRAKTLSPREPDRKPKISE